MELSAPRLSPLWLIRSVHKGVCKTPESDRHSQSVAGFNYYSRVSPENVEELHRAFRPVI